MPLTVSEKGGSSRPLTPAGTHIARCIQIIDLGTQDDTYLGKPKIIPKVRISWELPTELAVFSEEQGEQPFMISKEYTANLGEKANLRHDLEGWRGRPFTAEELKGFDLKAVLGHACMITVMHQLARDGKKTYDKVASVTALPKDPATKKKMLAPPQINPSVVYDIADGENDVFDSLPDWIKDKIKASREFREPSRTHPADEQPYDADDLASDDYPF